MFGLEIKFHLILEIRKYLYVIEDYLLIVFSNFYSQLRCNIFSIYNFQKIVEFFAFTMNQLLHVHNRNIRILYNELLQTESSNISYQNQILLVLIILFNLFVKNSQVTAFIAYPIQTSIYNDLNGANVRRQMLNQLLCISV